MIQQSSTYTITFLMVLSSDHVSPATGKTVTVNISKAGAAFGAAAGTVTEIANGWYKCAFTTADTGTLGDLSVNCTATGCDNQDFRVQIVAFNPLSATNLGLTALPTANPGANSGLPTCDANDAVKIQAGTGTGQLDVTSGVVKANLVQILATAITETIAGNIAAAFKKLLDVASAVATVATQWADAATYTSGRGANLDNLNATVSSRLASNLDGNGLQKVDVEDWKGAVAAAMTGDAYARLGAPTGASVSADIAAVETHASAVDALTAAKLDATISSRLASNLDVNGLQKVDVEDWKGAPAAALTGDAYAEAVAIKSDLDGGVTLTSAERTATADIMLDRDIGAGTDTGTNSKRTVRQALRVLRNKVDIPGGTVYKEDDATAAFTFTTTTAPGNPVTVVDPT